MMRLISLFLAIFSSATLAFAAPVPAPDIPLNSVWVQRVVDADTGRSVILFSLVVQEKSEIGYGVVRYEIGNAPLVHFRITRNLGQGSSVSSGKQGNGKLYDFPLTDGKTWENQTFWVNDLGQSGEDNIIYTVRGQQALVTSAGEFFVVKVTGVGVWKNHVTNESGPLYATLYYAPEAQMTVRSERTSGSSDPKEKVVKDIFELVYFKLGPQEK